MPRFIRLTVLRLPKDEGERHATWLEIFFDLIFAVIVIQLSTRLLSHLDFINILETSALLMPIVWTWASYTVFAARFDNNDAIHWLMTFVIMFAAAIMAIQIRFALEQGANGFAIGFLIAQISILLLYSRTVYDNLTPKKLTSFYMIGFTLGGVFWVISLFFAPPIKFILWTLGMTIYLLIPWIGRNRILSQAPLDTVYIPERFGAFTVIILGQTVAAVVFGLESASWHLSSAIMSILAFILSALIWVQYYSLSQIANYKCTLGSGQPYIYSHVPLIISLMLIGVCAEDLIKSSGQIHASVNLFFCFSIILYLTSFYLLNHFTVRQFKIIKRSYLAGIIATLFLVFFYSLSSLIIM
ncbi:MAG: low temperature requirement protein A, partial [Gammaproteobacteria bacterium]